MKYVAIGFIILGICRSARIYLKTLDRQVEYLKDWEKIFRFWREWIGRFSCSVDELVLQTSSNSATAELGVSKEMNNKSFDEILHDVLTCNEIIFSDKQVIIEVLKNIGNSMVESELESLSYAISKLQILINEREKIFKERKELAYKLTPLLCGALVVILW